MEQTQWLTAEEQRLWRAFLTVTGAIPARLDSELKECTGIGLDDYEVFVHLSEADDQRVRMSELSEKLLHSRSRLTQRIDRLEKRGLVRRQPCEDDKRGTWAVLTAEGLAALEAAASHHVGHAREHLFDHLDPDDVSTLRPIVERLAAAHQPV